eukprot:5261044-Lingulodinium_polyedra.AAC.1
MLASELELEFQEGRILITEEKRDDPNLISTIQTTLQAAWKFQKFTESRWLTVGASARSLVVALLTGVMDLVEQIEEDPHAMLWYLGGFKRLVPSRRQFM